MKDIFNINDNDYINLKKAWLKAADDLKIEISFNIKIKDNKYSGLILIKNFGSRKGTVIQNINNMDLDEVFLAKEGYYSSFLNPIHYGKYNRKRFIETLNDWGWYGKVDIKPNWYRKIKN